MSRHSRDRHWVEINADGTVDETAVRVPTGHYLGWSLAQEAGGSPIEVRFPDGSPFADGRVVLRGREASRLHQIRSVAGTSPREYECRIRTARGEARLTVIVDPIPTGEMIDPV